MKVRRVDFSADEFLVGTRSLSDAECGVYWRACSLIYSHGGPIPIDELRRWCSSRKGDFDRIVDLLVSSGKLTRNQHELDQKRARTELERATERARKWRENGTKGGRPSKEINEVEKPSGFCENNRAFNHQLSTINQDIDKSISLSSKAGASDAQAMLKIWRDELGDLLASPRKLTKPRVQKCCARLRDDLGGDIENWRAVCHRIRRSKFFTEGHWRASIDWVLEPKNMTKVLEGNYDDREQRQPIPFQRAELPGPKGPPPTPDELWGPGGLLEQEAIQRTH